MPGDRPNPFNSPLIIKEEICAKNQSREREIQLALAQSSG